MKQSVKAKRAIRHQSKMKKVSKLSLVSLMDIFTILVFFLIVNSSSVEVLEADKSIKLPKSISKTLAEDSLLLLINDKTLILQGKKIADIADIANSDAKVVAALSEELAYHKARQARSDDPNALNAITVMGDKNLEYSLLKKILLTCAKAGFGDISLAVEQGTKKGASDVQSDS